jgi:parvulin-like peptidyl-prolyl isomerase
MEGNGLPKQPNMQSNFPTTSAGKSGRKRIILISAAYILLVCVIIGLPFYVKTLAPKRKTVLQVGEARITTQDLVKRLRLHPPTTGPNQLEAVTNLLQEMQNEELIRQEAVKLNITVTDQELDQEIRRRVMASAPAEGKFEELFNNLLRRIGLQEKEYRSLVQTDIFRSKLFLHFLNRTPDLAEQIYFSAIITGTVEKAEAVWNRLQKGEDFSRAAKETSIDMNSAKKGGDFGWIPKGVDDLNTPGQVKVMGILTKTKAEAERIREMIMAGQDIGKLARSFSLDEKTAKEGGYLGWVSADFREGKPFAAEVYELNPGEVSRPLQAPEGLWIIKLIDKSPRGKVIDDIAFQLPVGKVSPPINTIKGFYILKVSAQDKQRPLTKEQKVSLGEKGFSEWLAAAADKGRQEGRIKWDWGSETYHWVITHLN